jgi:hypothetical protein
LPVFVTSQETRSISCVAENSAVTLELGAESDHLATQLTKQQRVMAVKDVPSLESPALYLGLENSEIRETYGGDRLPAYPEPKKTKQGLHLFPPDHPTHWEVGFRLRAALRRASTERSSEDATGTHARPRPHISRAHWHSYWVGKWKLASLRRAAS